MTEVVKYAFGLFLMVVLVLGFFGARANWKGYLVGGVLGTLLTVIAWAIIGSMITSLMAEATMSRPVPSREGITLNREEEFTDYTTAAWNLFINVAVNLAVLGWIMGGLGGALFLRIGKSRLFLDPKDEPETPPQAKTEAEKSEPETEQKQDD
ncbi:Hypothetical protein PBC10988_7990 [Planctomycetales bacterium 10988]|nr:Hypothetical protein PBC10988_7990 [Planctomycetales bacterium 10988]